MDGTKVLRSLDGYFHDSEIVFTGNQSTWISSSTRLIIYIYMFFFQRPSSPMTMICCPLLSKIDVCDRWLSQCFNVPEVTVYLTTTALFPGPLAPGLYLLFSLTVMKPAFKEWDAGSEASQIRSVERLAG